MPEIEEEQPEIAFELTILGGGEAELHTIAIGMASTPTIIIKTTANDDVSKVTFHITAGDPVTADAQGISELADVLELIVEGLRSPEMAARIAVDD